MRAFFRDNGLSIALISLFMASVIGMVLTGWNAHNEELAEHGLPVLGLAAYVGTGSFLSALFENWESEFLQMGAYVVLTAMLYQRGSSESRDPDSPYRQGDDEKELTMGSRLLAWLYSYSLGLTLSALFLVSFVLHWFASMQAANAEAAIHGAQMQGALAHLASPRLWFESFQNWQSEFLSTAMLVILSIFLRHKGSPESKPVTSPNSKTGS